MIASNRLGLLASMHAPTHGPLDPVVVLELGPVHITRAVITTWVLMAVLIIASVMATRALAVRPSRWQTVLELLIVTMQQQIEEIMRRPARPFLPLLGTLFVFLLFANLISLIPGVRSPTAHLETAAALAVIVFVAVRYYGVKLSGVRGHLATFAQPNILMVPLNIIGELARTVALTVRLFGNIMSGQLLIAVVIALMGFLVPIPLMAMGIITGVVQAYIFTVLAAVFIAAGIGAMEETEKGNHS